LYLNNGQLGSLFSNSPGSVLAMLNDKDKSPGDKLDHLFVQTLSRLPTAGERERFESLISSGKDAEDVRRDLVWALITCSEFRFNH
jgi:hypothetical protein